MAQNPPTNKFSSFIGTSLLIAVIAFTILINVDNKKEEEDLTEIEEEIYFEPFTEYDVATFWKLENLQTKIVSSDDSKTLIKIDKNLEGTSSNSSNKKASVSYGTVVFKKADYESQKDGVLFQDVKIDSLTTNLNKATKLMEIGNIFIDYQIHSVITNVVYGNFTTIYLKDRRQVFLIKEGTEIKGDYYQE